MRIRWRGFELPTHVQLETKSATPCYGKFTAEPFERGYGVTIGNSLRRVLLSSLEGAGVRSMRVQVTAKSGDGKPKTVSASHEFTALPGLYEDVTDLVLNIKELRLRIHADEQIVMKLEKHGRGPVTANDITRDERFEIVNPGLHLCTLTDDVALSIQLAAGKGRGYRTAEENINPEAPAGTIAVDSIFTPVRRVRYHVENTRVGQQTDYDRLVLEIWTDGTLSPELALVESSTILRKHFNAFVKYFELGKQLEAVVAPAAVEAEAAEEVEARELATKLAQSVSVLELSTRAENALHAANLKTLGELVKLPEAELAKIKALGRTVVKEIKKKLSDMGLSLGMEQQVETTPAAEETPTA